MNINDTNTQPVDLDAPVSVAGRIAAGEMILTPAAKESIPGAEKIFQQGVDAGASYDDIEKMLGKEAPRTFRKKPLVPLNRPWFRVSKQDFINPDNADAVMAFAEDRGDGVKRLYSFPVFFSSDSIDAVLSEGFVCFKGKKLKFSRDTHGRCMEMPEIEKGRRKFGVRKLVVRKPRCDPNTCDEFANEECNHSATLNFHVPGVMGFGVVQLKFRSVNAASAIRTHLVMAMSGLGRISGLFAGEPMFWLAKRRQFVNKVDWTTGNIARVEQQIITIDARGVDMAALFATRESQETARLAAPAENPEPHEIAIIMDKQCVSAGTVQPAESEDGARVEDSGEPAQPKIATTLAGTGPNVSVYKTIDKSGRLLQRKKDVFARAERLSISQNVFGNWGYSVHGEECFKIPEKLSAIEARLDEAESTGDTTAWMEFEPQKSGAPF